MGAAVRGRAQCFFSASFHDESAPGAGRCAHYQFHSTRIACYAFNQTRFNRIGIVVANIHRVALKRHTVGGYFHKISGVRVKSIPSPGNRGGAQG